MSINYKKMTLDELCPLAEKGNPIAQYELGVRYSQGCRGIELCDNDLAVAWWLKAASQGHAPSQFTLAMENSLLEEEQKKWFLKAKSQDYPHDPGIWDPCDAQLDLATARLVGLHTFEQDVPGVIECLGDRDGWDATAWRAIAYALMAENDNSLTEVYAFLSISDTDNAFFLFLKGLVLKVAAHLETDSAEVFLEQALSCIQRSAEIGYPPACLELADAYTSGDMDKEDPERGFAIYQELAKKGNADAQWKAAFYIFDNSESPECPPDGLHWIKEAAERGHIEAQFQLAILHQNGYGFPSEDLDAAFLWFKRSAEKSFAEAQAYVGMCYLEGIGVTEDKPEAITWFIKAVDQGNALGMSYLGLCYLMGLGGLEQNSVKAIELITNAVEMDEPLGQYSLALCFLNGDGVEQDIPEGISLLKKAASQGRDDARELLVELGVVEPARKQASSKKRKWII